MSGDGVVALGGVDRGAVASALAAGDEHGVVRQAARPPPTGGRRACPRRGATCRRRGRSVSALGSATAGPLRTGPPSPPATRTSSFGSLVTAAGSTVAVAESRAWAGGAPVLRTSPSSRCRTAQRSRARSCRRTRRPRGPCRSPGAAWRSPSARGADIDPTPCEVVGRRVVDLGAGRTRPVLFTPPPLSDLAAAARDQDASVLEHGLHRRLEARGVPCLPACLRPLVFRRGRTPRRWACTSATRSPTGAWRWVGESSGPCPTAVRTAEAPLARKSIDAAFGPRVACRVVQLHASRATSLPVPPATSRHARPPAASPRRRSARSPARPLPKT